MNQLKNIGTIIIIMGMSLILWFLAEPTIDISFMSQLSYVIGGLSLTGLSLVFLLSARIKWIEQYFGGLDHVYVIHKYLAIFSVVAVMVHGMLTKVDPLIGSMGDRLVPTLGNLSQILFIVLTLVALLAKKIKYENWRIFHRLLIVPYIIGLYHTYINGKYDLLQINTISIWVAVTSVIGLVTAAYMLFIYQKKSFKHTGKITSINKLSDSVVELEMTLNAPINYQNGQYVFMKIFQKGLESAPHPFSISGSDGNKITIGIKVLGDFTQQLYDHLVLGTKVSMEGPYGHMVFEKGKQKQVWVAGGIGITPFISSLRDGLGDREVDLYYSYRNEDEALYKELLDDYQLNNPKLHVHYTTTSTMGRLKPESITANEDTSIFMCGPVKMITGFADYFKLTNKNTEVNFEAFSFR